MKCYTTNGKGLDGLRVIEDRPEPGAPGFGDVLVGVRAVSLNYRDLLVVKGLYGGPMDPPIIAASDMAGVVLEVGEGGNEFAVGDRVLNAPFRIWPAGILRPDWVKTFVGGADVDGVLAERLVYPAASLVKVPADLNFVEGSTLTIAGLTAWAAVVTHGKTKTGDWILTHGTGGVSIWAAQIAKSLGARVILTTSDLGKREFLVDTFGVDAVLDYNDSDWPKSVQQITHGGADVVVEVAGGPMLDQSIQACAYGARIGVIGILGGFESTIALINIVRRQIALRGIYMESAAELRAFARAVEAAQIRPHIDKTFPFEEVRKAYEHLESRAHIGKIVIELAAE